MSSRYPAEQGVDTPAALCCKDRVVLQSAVNLCYTAFCYQLGVSCVQHRDVCPHPTSSLCLWPCFGQAASQVSEWRMEWDWADMARWRPQPDKASWAGCQLENTTTLWALVETWWWSGNAELTFWELCSPGLRLMVYWLPRMPLGLQVVLRCQPALITWCYESWRNSSPTHNLL